MLEYNIVFAEKAKSDIGAIGDYIANTLSEPDTAESFISGLLQKISFLKTFPNIYHVIDGFSEPNQKIRCMSYKNHSIFYKISELERKVVILRIGYSRRDWDRILK